MVLWPQSYKVSPPEVELSSEGPGGAEVLLRADMLIFQDESRWEAPTLLLVWP